jgi:aminopeptidase
MLIDPNFARLADLLTGFSTSLKAGERVLIEAFDAPDAMVIALIRAAQARGAMPYVQINRARISRELMLRAVDAQIAPLAKVELGRMQKMDAYVALRGSDNIFETSDVPADKVALVSRLMKPVIDHRVRKTRWVVLRWPTPAMAQQAGMSTAAFEEFFFRVCTIDYARMIPGMKALVALMKRTNRVEIIGPGTDLKFSIKNIGAVECGGRYNIPDGEVFSCPVRESVEGTVQFNTPTVYQGASFDQVRLAFKRGRIVEATAGNGDNKRLNQILDSDPGARYLGEFALGFNPYIREAMRDILFDEKIAGSFHLTPGQAYTECDNGNKSQVHWDLVCIPRPEHGGGEIRFDGKVVRRDGRFVVPALRRLNPEDLLRNAAART